MKPNKKVDTYASKPRRFAPRHLPSGLILSIGHEGMKERQLKVQRYITTEDLWCDVDHNPMVLTTRDRNRWSGFRHIS